VSTATARPPSCLIGIGISNGLDFSRGEKRLYYTDSEARRIYVFDYDRRTGAIANQRVFADESGKEEMPDGMTLDADGNVWSASWNGWSIVRYGPDGRETQRIKFPAKKITSVIFGGPNLATMYVTSASPRQSEAEDNGSDAGKVFTLQIPGVRGLPEFYSRIGM